MVTFNLLDPHYFGNLHFLFSMYAHRIRNAGSAALAMCYVAAGRMDAYTQEGIHVWDMAAGELLVREAGGVVMDTEGTQLLA